MAVDTTWEVFVRLVKRNMTVPEVADDLAIKRQSVNHHISKLRKQRAIAEDPAFVKPKRYKAGRWAAKYERHNGPQKERRVDRYGEAHRRQYKATLVPGELEALPDFETEWETKGTLCRIWTEGFHGGGYTIQESLGLRTGNRSLLITPPPFHGADAEEQAVEDERTKKYVHLLCNRLQEQYGYRRAIGKPIVEVSPKEFAFAGVGHGEKFVATRQDGEKVWMDDTPSKDTVESTSRSWAEAVTHVDVDQERQDAELVDLRAALAASKAAYARQQELTALELERIKVENETALLRMEAARARYDAAHALTESVVDTVSAGSSAALSQAHASAATAPASQDRATGAASEVV